FRQALLGDGREPDQWSELLRQTAARLIDQKRRQAVLVLAWQCWQLDDQPRANHLFGTAFDVTPEKERLGMTLAAIGYLRETGQLAHADELLQRLLADPKLAGKASLWRLSEQLAQQRDMPARQFACLERAL